MGNINTKPNIMASFCIFFESKYFILFLSLLTVLTWSVTTYIKISWPYALPYIIFCVLIILINITKAKCYSLASMFMLCIAGNGNIPIPTDNKVPIFFIAIFGVITSGFTLFNYFKNSKRNLKILLEPLILILIVMSVIMLVSIIKSPVKLKSLALTGLFMLNIVMAIIPLVIDVDKEKMKKYLAWSAIAFMVVTATQFFIAIGVKYNVVKDFSLVLTALRKKQIELYWAIGNHFVVILNMGVAFAIYRFFRTKSIEERIFVTLMALYGLFAVILTFSRGGYVGLAVLLISLLGIIIFGNKQKKTLLIFIPTCLVLLLVTLIVLDKTGTLDLLIKYYKEMGVSENGRDQIREFAIKLFKGNWLLGTGWGSWKYYNAIYFNQNIYNYHNYLLQASTAGIFSIIAFIIYIIIVLNICCKKHFFQLVMLAITLMFLAHGWVDTIYYNRVLMPYYTIFIAYCVVLNKHGKKQIDNIG